MSQPIRYTVSFPDAEHHYADLEAVIPTEGEDGLELTMAVWTPGSYLIREFSRHVEDLTAAAEDGTALPLTQTLKNRWRVETGGRSRVVLRYRLYCREMSVRTNFVDSSFALLNGAPTFITRVGAAATTVPHEVEVVLPAAWERAVTALPAVAVGRPNTFLAADYDTLVDSPIYAGSGAVHRFEVDGIEHLLLNEGEDADDEIWDGPRSAGDVQRIVEEQRDFWGSLPYPRYVFFNLITGARGGLEHKASSVLMTSRWRGRSHKDYRSWLGLVSHELFHAWNVKRLRPHALGPFDYEHEVYTESLWVAEGITSYYDDLLLHRAGLLDQDEYLEQLSESIRRLQETPGRQVQSLASSSFNAWIKQYRPNENSVNTAVSYYVKGAVVAFLLDMRIRRASGGARSLDDVLRGAFARWSGERGFLPEELQGLASEVAGEDLGPWFERTLSSTEELSFDEALEWLGLRFGVAPKEDGKRRREPPSGWLGAETAVRQGRLRVTTVRRDTPAWQAGLNVQDEILAIDDYRVPPHGLSDRLEAYRPGERVELLIARRDRLRRLQVELGEEPEKEIELEVVDEATQQQEAQLEAWLGGSR